MFLLVGLGNPGAEYRYTRHNIGFLFLDYLASSEKFPDFKPRFESLCSAGQINGEKVILQKPQTFMNLSGRAVGQLAGFYEIPSEHVFVFHDDIDLSPFDVRIKKGGSSGGHNGLRSIDPVIGRDYWRVRIGVGRPETKDQVTNYVVSNFMKKDYEHFETVVFPEISKMLLERFCSGN
ncbi:MAG: aminoacyl-tRNA hydrolase [Holosporales bacterium]|jgi:PTH1 family peptidyl-tRNA hydrolase|nr:aminoacyl-tRNA hydrolase [Holosporales bacterium]